MLETFCLFWRVPEAGKSFRMATGHDAPVMSGRQFDAELGAGSTHLARQAGAWNGAA